jgi:hypothetical protein
MKHEKDQSGRAIGNLADESQRLQLFKSILYLNAQDVTDCDAFAYVYVAYPFGYRSLFATYRATMALVALRHCM